MTDAFMVLKGDQELLKRTFEMATGDGWTGPRPRHQEGSHVVM